MISIKPNNIANYERMTNDPDPAMVGTLSFSYLIADFSTNLYFSVLLLFFQIQLLIASSITTVSCGQHWNLFGFVMYV